MSRRLFLGRAGTGKTHACLDLLTQALGEGRKGLLLVPTYSQAEHLRYALLDRTGGLSEHAVTTFEGIAEKAAGVRLSALVPVAVRDRVAARVLRATFPAAAEQAGFRAEFLAAVKEIKEQGLPVADALARARAHFPDGSRGRQLFEAYARYAGELPGPDHEDLLLQARDRLDVELDLLLVDGFHDFTPVQREIVGRLAAEAAETVVTLPFDPDEPGDATFATAARTAESFPGYARVALRGNRRADGALATLEQRLFRPSADPVSAEGIEVIACPSEEDEADRVARLIARSGRPWNDFLLVRRSFDGYHPVYRAAFRRHRIPLRFYNPEPLGHTPVARAVTLWLRTLVGDVPPAELVPLLRSPYFLERPPARDVDELARELRRAGKAPAPELSAPQAPLADALRDRFGVRDALVAVPDGDLDVAIAARALSSILEEADAVGDLPLDEAAAHLLRRLPQLKGSVRDRRHRCVYAVEALDARQWEKQVVIVTGLGADAFPQQHRQDLFLRDDERKDLGEQRDLHLPPRSRRDEEERYLFYVALTRARERLVCTYPAFDEEGTPRPPSPYLDEALEHLDLKPRAIPLSEQYVPARDAVRRSDLLPIVADGLAHGGSALAAALYEREVVPRALLAWPRRLELIRARPIRGLEDPAAKLSASAINAYLRCPYLFLMRNVLGAQRDRELGLDPLTRGSIVHAALEQAAEDGRDPGEIFDEVFAKGTADFRLNLADRATQRWMRAVTVREGLRLREQRVKGVEQEIKFKVDDVTIRGRVDRVDQFSAGLLIRDYKTGKPKLKQAESGEDVQLDLYLLAYERPAGAVWEVLRRGKSVGFLVDELAGEVEGQFKILTREGLEARREATRALVRRVASEMRAGLLAVDPREPERCTRTDCDGFDLCRVQRARFLAKVAREEESR